MCPLSCMPNKKIGAQGRSLLGVMGMPIKMSSEKLQEKLWISKLWEWQNQKQFQHQVIMMLSHQKLSVMVHLNKTDLKWKWMQIVSSKAIKCLQPNTTLKRPWHKPNQRSFLSRSYQIRIKAKILIKLLRQKNMILVLTMPSNHSRELKYQEQNKGYSCQRTPKPHS